MIEYKFGSLFDAPECAILTHACNAQGVWGSGIAKEFKKRYPYSFLEYNKFCQEDVVGRSLITNEGIGCLITSFNYGKDVDKPKTILSNTDLALEEFFDIIHPRSMICSNKFNSGLFNVPWENTEVIINKYLERYPTVKWIVYTNDTSTNSESPNRK